MLAVVYRQTGNLVESGRWAFLTGDVTEAEVAAFERANPDPWLRMRMLRWEGDETELGDSAARARLRELTDAAERAGPPSAYEGPLRSSQQRSRFFRGTAIPCLFVVIALGGLGSLAAIGLIRILTWIIG